LSAAETARLLLAAAAVAAAAPCTLAQPRAPEEIVSGAAATIAEVIAARRAELNGDHAAIAALVDTLILPHFDMQRGSRAILAEHWATATPEARDRFVTAFYDYLVASYGDLLLYFRPDTLRVLPARVKTILKLNDGTEVGVDFVMVERGDSWRVVDIVAEGVSYVRTYRSQFRVDIAGDGLDSVIVWLQGKAARTAAEAQRPE
jgi:phospholipid transport system substrate-binding protein